MENTSDPLVIFMPSGKRGRFPVSTPVLTAARRLGVDLDSVCGGRGICSRCQVTPAYGSFPKHGVTVNDDALSEWNNVEERYRSKRGLLPGRRLGCQARIEADVVIDVPPESQVHRQVVRKRVEARDIVLKPDVRLYYVEVERPDMHEPSGDMERIARSFQDQWGISGVVVEPHLFGVLQPALRKGDWKVTCTLRRTTGGTHQTIGHIWPGYFDGDIHGLAIDLGSTTIAAHLCELRTGAVLASSGMMNPQIRFGEDLMSRVSYAMMNPGGAAEMTDSVREGINALIGEVAAEAGVEREHILDTALVCNPVMHHLFLGIDPVELGQAPFALAFSGARSIRSSEFGLKMNPGTRTYILPCIAGHVGADAAGVVLSESPQTSKDLVLVVDVGTNAEIILGNSNRVFACSSPTGPAFEGAQISCGQRAAPGAIERVRIDRDTGLPRFRVIGSELWSDDEGFHDSIAVTGITGICGSGIIELVAEMRLAGILDGSGLIGSPEQTGSPNCFLDGRTFSYLVSEGDDGGRQRVSVTNRDIREVQMAKAALYSGARLLMDKFGVDRVDRIVLAGAFGSHISPLHAMVLGMIPDCRIDKVSSAGNAAGTGARIALLNTDARAEIEAAVRKIHKVETAIEPRFQEHFVNASDIPNGSEPFPVLESTVSIPGVNFNIGFRKRNRAAGTARPRRRKMSP
ncbi:MAG: ASKHA domain-containing protein [Rhodobacteraceae bacterium]|nr:ASKHA domain-containing protein [Paracoccaceae bacterium]